MNNNKILSLCQLVCLRVRLLVHPGHVERSGNAFPRWNQPTHQSPSGSLGPSYPNLISLWTLSSLLSTLQMMLRHWKGFTQLTRYIFIISLWFLNDTSNRSTTIWTELGFSQGFSPSLNTSFHCIKHSSRPISSFSSSCALHLSQYSTIPSSVLPRSFFSNAKPWILAVMLSGTTMAFNIWPLRSLMRVTGFKWARETCNYQ